MPFNATETMADIPKTLSLEVITVVGIRLGCLNHALLTSQSIISSGLNHCGWIANHLSTDAARAADNVDTLRARMPAPLLDEVPYGVTPLQLENSARILLRE